MMDSIFKYIMGKVQIQGITDDNQLKTLSSTAEGHLEVAIHHPRLPFGAIHTENITPVFQTDPVYGINTTEVVATTGLAFESNKPTPGTTSGTNTGTSNLFTCSTGTTAYSFASMQSRNRLRYRPGQGVIARFTALFSTPATSTILVAGAGTGESGFYFGYNGTTFGILHSTRGVRAIQTLTISAAATTGGTIILRVNGLDYTVTIPTSTTTTRTAFDISQQIIPGWSMTASGSTVIFLSNSVGVKSDTFSLTRGTALVVAGTFAETLAGVASTDNWIPQTTWNGDKLDGNGTSGVTLNPQSGNVFQIDIQYLGFGSIVFKIEAGVAPNNPDFVVVHTLNYPNTETRTVVSQPSFPFTMAAYSSGSTTNVSVSVGSFACFIEGIKKFTGPRMTYFREAAAYVGSVASTYYPLFTIRNESVYASRANQAVVHLLSVGGAHSDNTPATLYLIKNATLSGPVNFATWSGSSCTKVDQGATTCTFASNEQLVFSLPIGNGGNALLAFTDDITLQPGETITLAGRAVQSTTPHFVCSLNTREDQ